MIKAAEACLTEQGRAEEAAVSISPGFHMKPQDKTLFGSLAKLVPSCFIRKFPTERDILYAFGKIDCKLYATIKQ